MLAFLLLGCGLLILQMTVLHYLPLWELKIDGLMLLVVYASLYVGGLKGIFLVFALGILMDVFGGSILGIHVLVYIVIFVLIKLISRNFVVKDVYYQQMPLVFLLCIIANIGVLFLNFVFMDGPILWSHLPVVFSQGLMTTALSYPFFKLFHYLERRFGLREAYEAAR